MVLPGLEAEKADTRTVARVTAEVLKATVPQEVAGIAFLSGGQSDLDATFHLNEINLTHWKRSLAIDIFIRPRTSCRCPVAMVEVGH